jgi:hypothetical protein
MDNTNTDINVEEIMRMIREEVARKKSEVPMLSPNARFDHCGDSQERPPVVVKESQLFRFVKKVQVFSNRLPFYDWIYTKAVKLKRFIPRSIEVISLDELCGYEDDSFIIAAYHIILSREPDSHGLDHYRTLLRVGRISKVEVIGRLMYSREGRRGSVRVKGLFLRYAFAILSRTTIVGPLFRWISACRLKK